MDFISLVFYLINSSLSNNLSKDRMFNQTINQIYDKEEVKYIFF